MTFWRLCYDFLYHLPYQLNIYLTDTVNDIKSDNEDVKKWYNWKNKKVGRVAEYGTASKMGLVKWPSTHSDSLRMAPQLFSD